MTQPVEKLLLSADEAAVALGCSRRHLFTLSHRAGGIPTVSVGARVMYDRRDLLAWIDSQKRPAGK